ncbi:RTA-like protein [Dactylonectria estremocensis]|uniref:RTA-like protein n=1 Tax=Dactylonectria estremocensis TaxID=1079267 RepID=A0A9P9DQQ8_9HYPO|nr:RTA-like protein [Dactylonectria estremocensis]
MSEPTRPERYHYDPSLAAAVIFAGLFGISGLAHLVQMIKGRAWYFAAFFVGVLFEVFGYLARAVSARQTPDWEDGPFIAQTLLLLLAPALFAASIYMILGRIIRILQAEKHSIIRVTWLTKIFVLGDVLSFLVQTAGGVMLTNADSQSDLDRGRNIVLTGLGIQITFFGIFIAVISAFHYRIVRSPTTASMETVLPWKRYMYVLYFASVLIMARSIFRVAEFAAGQESVLQTEEAFIYGLDATLMFICTVLFNVQHPSIVVQKHQYKPTEVELLSA